MEESVGLCLTCRWMRLATNRRGSTFYRCARAETDPMYPRYPQLPVVECEGYDKSTEQGARSSDTS